MTSIASSAAPSRAGFNVRRIREDFPILRQTVHGKPLYGGWPHDNSSGDTYGPVNYMLYVPFRAFLGWSGQWDGLPAAHGAAIAFDRAVVHHGIYVPQGVMAESLRRNGVPVASETVVVFHFSR